MKPKALRNYQLDQIAAKEVIQNQLEEAYKLLDAAETLSGSEHIFNADETGKLNDAVDAVKELAAYLRDTWQVRS
ncbi:hypothetical protein [Synechocystis sp. PCC 7509]|uniref:hypothetical protein n=1 Tax=Synechocystis sp. PCC 7509 TaxID=927677 RepID=UPI0002ABC1DD|nr:hypothetical protein [Synechocystis sp. PCC 7509]